MLTIRATQHYNRLLEELSSASRRFEIRFKNESRFMRIVDKILFFNRTFMTRYVTALFGKVYVPDRKWWAGLTASARYRLLRHEGKHLEDERRFSVFYWISYLLLLPSVFTFRSVWEWRAYKETIRAYFELGLDVPDSVLDHIVNNFVGPDYFFMGPFKRFWKRKFRKLRDKLRTEYKTCQ